MRWRGGATNEPGGWVDIDLSNMHRPMLRHDAWWDEEHVHGDGYVDLSWGNGHGDPVWSIGIQFFLPAWFMRWLDQRWAEKHHVT